MEEDLRRHQLAREVIPELTEDLERFLNYFPRIAQRRVGDRIAVQGSLASDVLAWTALATPRDQSQTPARCFAASCVLDRDPHGHPIVLLAMCGMGAEVRDYVRGVAGAVPDLPPARLEDETGEAAGSVVEEVRGFLGRLRGREATSADGRRLGRLLLASAITIDPILAERDEIASFSTVGALALLEQAIPTENSGEKHELAATLELFAVELPGLVKHAETDLESDDEDEIEDEDDELDEDEVGDFNLDELISGIDLRLSVTEDTAEAADVAFDLASMLVIHSVVALGPSPLAFGPQARGVAAANALMSPDHELPPFDRAEGRALLNAVYSEAAALLRAEGAGQLAVTTGSVEEVLPELDDLVGAMQEVADIELDETLAGGLALVAGAAQALRAGIRLGHAEADRSRRMAAALGILDPLALADLPEARASAVDTLGELSKGTGRSAGPL